MDIIPYEDLKITTMTLIMTLSNIVTIQSAFLLLPITRIDIQQTRQSSKCKLPHCSIPGSILSMRTKNNVRGVIRNKTTPFKNAITLDISTTKKNISLKLSPMSIQMCGASSLEDGMEAADHLLGHLRKIQIILDRMHDNIELTDKCIDWVKKVTQGQPIVKLTHEEIQYPEVIMRVANPGEDFTILKCVLPIPTNLDAEIVAFLFSFCDDFIYHSDLCKKLDFIKIIKEVISGPIEVESVDEVMVNYNYSLGFEIDRVMLNHFIDGRNGFLSRYNNALANSVTVELPYEPMTPTTSKRKKNKVPHMSWLCYKSGAITFSGRGIANMKPVYYMFMETLSALKPYIELKT